MIRLERQSPDWASRYTGWQFKPGGEGRDGTDCYGLARVVHREQLGIRIPAKFGEYTSLEVGDDRPRRVFDDEAGSGRWRTIERPERIGALWVGTVAGLPHVGLVVSRLHMLHIVGVGAESCVEEFDTPTWRKRHRAWMEYAAIDVASRNGVDPARRELVQIPAGSTLEEIRAIVGVIDHPWLIATIDGEDVPREVWARVRPKPGRSVQFVARAAGGDQGGGKNVVRAVATIALVVASIYIGNVGATAMLGKAAIGTAKYAAVAGAISATSTIAGTLALQAILPPPGTSISDSGLGQSGSPSLQGVGNSARPYGRFNCPMGKNRITPPFAAMPYTENVGGKQYLRCLFDCGYGHLQLSEHKLGDTPIEEFEGVELEVREGLPTDEPMRLFSANVFEEAVGVQVMHGVEVVRTSATDAVEISADLVFPRGLARITAGGAREETTVQVSIDYRPTGTIDWIPVIGLVPTSSRGFDFLFRAPESTFGGVESITGDLLWSSAGEFGPNARPSYLPGTAWSWEARGYFYFPESGEYTFAVDGERAFELQVAGRTVVSRFGDAGIVGGGGSPNYGAHQGAVTLGSAAMIMRSRGGWVPFRIRVAGNSGGAIAVGVREPGSNVFRTLGVGDLRQGANANSAAGLRVEWWTWRTDRLTFSAATSDVLRETFAWGVAPGQYDVRVRRLTADADSDLLVNEVFWSALRTGRSGSPVRAKGRAMVALRIQATDQLQGVIDNYNCMAQTVADDWDEDSQEWIYRATSSPASLMRWALQGPANPLAVADDRLKLSKFAAFAESCSDRGLEFNAIVDFEGTLWDRLKDIAAAGRGSPNVEGDQFSVVVDEPRSVVAMHITPRNSRGATGEIVYPIQPHAIKARFVNAATGYQADEQPVYADGYSRLGGGGTLPATRFETFDYFGSVTWAEVFKRARYDIAVSKLRPEVVRREVDLEHLSATRGDLVMLQDDVMKIGQASARVIEVETDGSGATTAIGIDAEVGMEAGKQYTLRIQLGDRLGSWTSLVHVVPGGGQTLLYMAAPVHPAAGTPSVGDMAIFGESGRESREMIIRSIRPGRELSAMVELVDHATAVHTSDVGTIPPYDPGITRDPVFTYGPPMPEVIQIRSDDFVMVRQADGSLSPRMEITFQVPQVSGRAATHVQVRFRRKPVAGQAAGAFTYLPPVPVEAGIVMVDGVEEGVRYEIRIRAIDANSRASNWQAWWTPTPPDPDANGTRRPLEHTVVGKILPPPDLDSFDVMRLADGTRSFRFVLGEIPPDIAGVQIRYFSADIDPDADWEAMSPMHEGTLEGASPWESNAPPAGHWRFAIKMIDTSGNESRNALYVNKRLGPPRQENVLASVDAKAEGWTGTKTDCYVSNDGDLYAVGRIAWSTTAAWNTGLMWNQDPATLMVYEQPAIDVGAVVDAELELQVVAVVGVVRAYVNWSQDGTIWAGWTLAETVAGATVQGQYFRFKIEVEVGAGTQQIGHLAGALFMVRGQTVQQIIEDLNTATLETRYREGPGVIRLPIDSRLFAIVRSVSVGFNGQGVGRSWELVDRIPDPGPQVRLYDGEDLADARIDAVVRGIRAAEQVEPLGGGLVSLPSESPWIVLI